MQTIFIIDPNNITKEASIYTWLESVLKDAKEIAFQALEGADHDDYKFYRYELDLPEETRSREKVLIEIIINFKLAIASYEGNQDNGMYVMLVSDAPHIGYECSVICEDNLLYPKFRILIEE